MQHINAKHHFNVLLSTFIFAATTVPVSNKTLSSAAL